MSARLTVSLIATVKDERANLDVWLAGLERQSRTPDEIIIVDGGSHDGTWEALSSWLAPCELILLRVPGTSISSGRNLAMSRARFNVIAVTDAGTVAETHWLERLIEPFNDATADASTGFFRPSVEGVWQRSLAAATLPEVDEIDAETFLPSSRSVAVRSSWVRRGFEYPEWLDYCEDLVWDLQLKRGGARFVMVPDALVDFAVRPNWRSFWRQYYRYARGDGKAGLFAKRHCVRYLTYLAGSMVLIRRQPFEVALAGVLACAYVSKPVERLLRRERTSDMPPAHTLCALGLIPVHRLVGDLAKMAGYPTGLAWRWRHYGAIGPRTSWRRIRPDGSLWHPGSTAAETPPPEA